MDESIVWYSRHHYGIENFLLKNGWVKSLEFGTVSFCKENNVGIDLTEDEAVFIGESGDYYHMPINCFTKYTMIGKMITDRILAIDFKD